MCGGEGLTGGLAEKFTSGDSKWLFIFVLMIFLKKHIIAIKGMYLVSFM